MRMLTKKATASSCSYMNTEVCKWSTATGITNTTTLNILDTLVQQFKDSSLWTLIKLCNPVAGGTATSHAYNIKDTGTYKLTFFGTVTHASTGMTGNGTTGYANTGLNANTVYPSGFMTIGISSRTNVDGVYVDIGALSPTNHYLQIYSRLGNTFYGQVNTNNSISENIVNSNSQGFFLAGRTAATTTVIEKNSAATNSAATSMAIVDNNIYVMAQNNAGTASFFSPREIDFVLICDALSVAQSKTMGNIVTAYQIRMGRWL